MVPQPSGRSDAAREQEGHLCGPRRRLCHPPAGATNADDSRTRKCFGLGTGETDWRSDKKRGGNPTIAWRLGPLNRSAPNSISRSVAISRVAFTDVGPLRSICRATSTSETAPLAVKPASRRVGRRVPPSAPQWKEIHFRSTGPALANTRRARRPILEAVNPRVRRNPFPVRSLKVRYPRW